MNELALFAGAGGGLLATKWLLGFKTVCYVENNPYRVEVLEARIGDGLLDDAPIWDDARTFDGRPWRGCVDIVTAGFPCQPFSQSGNKLADRDKRNLWPDTIRIIREVRPEWCLLENVSGLLSGSHGYFGQILRDLAESGYDAKWRMLSAAAIGYPHQRNRLWIVAYAHEGDGSARLGFFHNGAHNPLFACNYAKRLITQLQAGTLFDGSNNGMADRVDRLKAIGDGQVPAVVRAAWRLLT